MGPTKIEMKFDADLTGQYQLCISNMDNQHLQVEIKISTGEFSNDFSKSITKKHLKPIEL